MAMRYKFLFSYVTVALLVLLCGHSTLSALNPMEADVSRRIIDSISSSYVNWDIASISGKLKMNGLPLNPGVKVFMKRDSCVIISVRAPFMGEVGRAEIAGDSILVVNKMKKTYVKESIATIMSYCPVTVSDIQNILLARPVIVGCGILSPQLAENVEIYPDPEDGYSLIPSQNVELEDFNYGYLIDGLARVSALMVIPSANPETAVCVSYDYGSKGYDINVIYESADRTQGGTLELDYPRWDGSPVDPVKLNNRYIRMDFPDFMKSF